MPIEFKPARRENIWLRTMLMAPSGGGKTLGALIIACGLFDGTLPVGMVDTERQRGLLYADKFREYFHHPMVDDHSPDAWIEAIEAAEDQMPGGVLILDSFSHEWMGKGGILQMADRFGEWKTVRPKHTEVIDRIMNANLHVIACVRAKMKYEVTEEEREGGRGTRQVIRKLGVGPIQDDAIIYEFDIVGMTDADTHETTFSGRGPFDGQAFVIDESTPEALTRWLSEGEPPAPPEIASDESVEELRKLLEEEGYKPDVIEDRFAKARRANRGQIHPGYVEENLTKAKERLAAKRTPTPQVQQETQPEPVTA